MDLRTARYLLRKDALRSSLYSPTAAFEADVAGCAGDKVDVFILPLAIARRINYDILTIQAIDHVLLSRETHKIKLYRFHT
jgi:hypothetical protein